MRSIREKILLGVKRLLRGSDGFTEDWYSASQLKSLVAAVEKVRTLDGVIMEIGSWEGKSTCALANAAYPEPVVAVDTWQGTIAEGENHPSVIQARARDVYSDFLANVKTHTRGNVIARRSDCFEFLAAWAGRIKFCHIDAAHDYDSVKRTIEMLKPFLVTGAVLCGDDFLSANAGRTDLGGGVERAVREVCPGFATQKNFWYWVNARVTGGAIDASRPNP